MRVNRYRILKRRALFRMIGVLMFLSVKNLAFTENVMARHKHVEENGGNRLLLRVLGEIFCLSVSFGTVVMNVVDTLKPRYKALREEAEAAAALVSWEA